MTNIVCAGSAGSLILAEHKISGRVNMDIDVCLRLHRGGLSFYGKELGCFP